MLLAECSLIALYFDLRGLDCPAHTTPLFELFAERFQCVGGFRYPLDDGDSFAATAFRFPPNANDAIAGGCGSVRSADT